MNAHEASDNRRLVDLYSAVGLERLDAGNVDSGCFYLTQAFVFALEAGLDDERFLRKLLVSYGREE